MNFKITVIAKFNKFSQWEKFIRELKTIKKNQMDILKLKIIMKLRLNRSA